MDQGHFDVNNGITLCYGCHERVTGNEEYYAPILLKLVAESTPGRASIITSVIMNRFIDDQDEQEDRAGQ